jgi:hypothetical protein
MTTDVVTDLINRRRDKAIAAILGVKEREADPHLPPDVRRALRKVVLDQLNDLSGLVGDLVGALTTAQDGTVVLNELYLRKIAEIHEAVTTTGDGR